MVSSTAARCRLGIASGALILVGLAVPMFRGDIFDFGDLVVTHLPFRQFYAECLQRGERFHWYPDIYCGFDLQGEGQAGLYHPLHWALYRWVPLDLAFNLEFLSSYLLLLPGMALLLRRWVVPWDAAVLAGLCFTFGGFNLVHFMHLNVVSVVAHIPWMLLAVDGLVRSRRPGDRAWWMLLLGVATASQMLLGHPQFVWYSGMVEAAYAIFLLAIGAGPWRRIATLGFAKVLGLFAAGIQLMPTLDAAARSTRSAPGPDYLAVGSLHPANFLQTIAPYLYRSRVYAPETWIIDHHQPPAISVTDWRTHEFGFYGGALVVVLIAWLLIRWRQIEPRFGRLAAWSGIILGSGAILSLGAFSPLFPSLLRIPTFDMFRVSARAVLLIDLASAILVGLAFSELSRVSARAEVVPWRRLWPLAAVVLASVATAVGVPALAQTWPERLVAEGLSPPAQIWAGVLLVGASAGVVAAAARGWRPALGLAIVLLAVDLGAYAFTFLNHFDAMSPAEVSSLFRDPDRLDGTRVLVNDNRWAMAGHRITHGNASLVPRRRLDYSDPACRRLAGVGWVVEDGSWAVRRVADPLPRARLVTRAIRSHQPMADIQQIDVATTALIDADSPPLWGTPGRAEIRRDLPGRIRVVTQAEGSQLLVISESYHPGWRAEVDGRPAPVVATYGDFLGCLVGPGRSLVEFRFEPRSVQAGWIASAAGAGGLLLGFVWLRLQPSAPRSPGTSTSALPLGLRRSRHRTSRAGLAEEPIGRRG